MVCGRSYRKCFFGPGLTLIAQAHKFQVATIPYLLLANFSWPSPCYTCKRHSLIEWSCEKKNCHQIFCMYKETSPLWLIKYEGRQLFLLGHDHVLVGGLHCLFWTLSSNMWIGLDKLKRYKWESTTPRHSNFIFTRSL